MLLLISICSSILFIFYGFLCVFSQKMVTEFERYGLARFRVLVGLLEIFGSIGLIVGYFFSPAIQLVSSVGLTILMILAVQLRVRLKDPFIEILPAFGLMIINGMIVLTIVM